MIAIKFSQLVEDYSKRRAEKYFVGSYQSVSSRHNDYNLSPIYHGYESTHPDSRLQLLRLWSEAQQALGTTKRKVVIRVLANWQQLQRTEQPNRNLPLYNSVDKLAGERQSAVEMLERASLESFHSLTCDSHCSFSQALLVAKWKLKATKALLSEMPLLYFYVKTFAYAFSDTREKESFLSHITVYFQ